MIWRAFEARRLGRLLSEGDALLQSRLAIVWGLVGLLAVVTGVWALLALRPRRRRHTLHLEDREPPPPGQ